MKTLACKDTGMMECNWKGSASSEDELLTKVAEHAKQQHHLDLTPQMKEEARKVIHEG